MKKVSPIVIFVISLFLINCSSNKGVVGNHPDPFEFSLIDSVSGSKSELYVKAHSWMAKSFGSSKEVIQMADKEAGRIIGKALMTCTVHDMIPHVDNIYYTITIDTKDGKYRCVLSDFNHSGGSLPKGEFAFSYGSLNQREVDYGNLKFQLIKDVAARKSKLALEGLKSSMQTKEKEF